MKDQHTKIKGYRDLSQQEIDLMNLIKTHGEKTSALLEEVHKFASQSPDGLRAIDIAKVQLQTGQMWLVRSIALPESF